MRLDLVLKQSRLIKRRTIAKDLCDEGKISINGKVSKPSSEVSDGDILTLKLGIKTIIVKITYIKQGNRLIPTAEEIKDNHA
ncbi:MAG: RNA-binding S4 domain-containing protein [Bacilli bacterium]|nr:RNA-binding S4 domain-containing protein [Bacilli bacterium]